jgi:hypothetical protein
MRKLNRDYPLSDTPDPGDRRPLTKKEYKEEKKQARWRNNIEESREGTLVDKRIDRAARIGSAVGEAISTATGITALADAIKPSGRRRRND